VPTSTDMSLSDLRIPDAVGAIVQSHAASLWPYKLVAWILEDLLRRFALGQNEQAPTFNLQTNTPVTHLQRLSNSTSSWIVHTPNGQIAARQVLLASNAYTSHLLPEFSDLIVPVRGQVTALLPPNGPPPELEHSYVFLALPEDEPSQDDYLVQRPSPGHLILGGGRSKGTERGVGMSRDDELDPVVGNHLRASLCKAMDLSTGRKDVSKTADDELEARYEWTGIMGYSRDHSPWVGQVTENLGGGPGLWVCAGFTGHGMPRTALCARAASQMMGGTRRDGLDLPPEFYVTDDRVEKSRQKDEVRIADEKNDWMFG
jgi:glycine/D-amino acid oxidase-like deaminating enzyme